MWSFVPFTKMSEQSARRQQTFTQAQADLDHVLCMLGNRELRVAAKAFKNERSARVVTDREVGFSVCHEELDQMFEIAVHAFRDLRTTTLQAELYKQLADRTKDHYLKAKEKLDLELKEANATIKRQKKRISILEPKARYFDRLAKHRKRIMNKKTKVY